MIRTLCVCFAIATLGVSACGGSSSTKNGTGGAGGAAAGAGGTVVAGAGGAVAGAGAGGSAGAAGAGGAIGGGGGAAAGAGGGAAAGAGGGGGSPVDVPITDATYDIGEVPSNVNLDTAPMTAGEVVCERVFSCCTADERARNQLFASQATCSASISTILTALASAPDESIRKGRVTYNSTALAGCLQQYMMQDCPTARTSGGLSAFQNCKFITPLVPVGGACVQHYECVAGWCSGVSGATEGTCAAKVADGQPCASGLSDECTGGLCIPTTKICATAPVTGLCTAF